MITVITARNGAQGAAANGSSSSLSADTNLTPREREILAKIVVGNSSKEVARCLSISPRTVDFHRANLLKKFAAKNTADLVRIVAHRF
jgi:DNA-binding CsgD family transcriptional regulator